MSEKKFNLATVATGESIDDYRRTKMTDQPPCQPELKVGRKNVGQMPEILRRTWLQWLGYKNKAPATEEGRIRVDAEKRKNVLDILQFQLVPLLGRCSRDEIGDLYVDEEWNIWQTLDE
jgi:hypothetical protein